MLLILMIAAAVFAILLIGGAAWQRIETARDLSRTPPAGRFIEVEPGRRLHAYIAGSGTPAVVFESGVAATFTPSRTTCLTRLRDPNCFLISASAFNAAICAASRPAFTSSVFPMIPATFTAWPDVASMPLKKRRFPV